MPPAAARGFAGGAAITGAAGDDGGMANIGEPVREGEWPEFDPADLPPVEEPAAPAPSADPVPG